MESDAVNRKWTDNTMIERKRTKIHSMVHKYTAQED